MRYKLIHADDDCMEWENRSLDDDHYDGWITIQFQAHGQEYAWEVARVVVETGVRTPGRVIDGGASPSWDAALLAAEAVLHEQIALDYRHEAAVEAAVVGAWTTVKERPPA